jgi:hypothetical protein
LTSPAFNYDALLEDLATRVAAKLRGELGNGSSNGAGIKPRLLTIEQAAVYLGRSQEAVKHLVTSGALPRCRQTAACFWTCMTWTPGSKSIKRRASEVFP